MNSFPALAKANGNSKQTWKAATDIFWWRKQRQISLKNSWPLFCKFLAKNCNVLLAWSGHPDQAKSRGKTAATLLLCKRKFVLGCTNSRRDFPSHRGAPSQAAPPTMAAIHNQEPFWHGICHTALFAPSQLLFQEKNHFRAKKIPGYRLKSRTEKPRHRRGKLSIQKAAKGSPGNTYRWNKI